RFNQQHIFAMRQRTANGTMHLWHATQAIGILNTGIVFEMRLTNFAFPKKSEQMFCCCSLSRMGPRVLQTSIKCSRGAFERLEAHGARNVRETRQPFRAKKCKPSYCMHGLRSIQ